MEKYADILVVGGTVLTLNPAGDIIEDGAVAVSGDRIAAVGKRSDLEGWHIARKMDAGGGIIMPGLVNTHTHAAMTCFRGLADDLPLMDWLNNHIFPAETRLNHEMVRCGTLLACAEMILSGTTCFCDMYLFEDAVAEAAKSAGMRAVVGEVLYDFPSPNYGPLENGFAYTESLAGKWRDDPLISIAVEPHSPYLCAPDLLRRAARIARDHDIPLIIHLSETQGEVAQIREKYGKTPVGHLADLGVPGPNLLACHCVVLDEQDISLLRQHDVKVSHNPESNMKLASGVAPVPKLLEAGICVGLGTDGCSSNNNLDLFAEMDVVAKLHKAFSLDPTVMDAKTVLRMATSEGARAIGLGSVTGMLEPGRQADLIIVDTNKPHLTPMYHPESHLVYSARGSDVSASMIAGKIVMENRQLLTIDIEKAMSDVNEIAHELRRWK